MPLLELGTAFRPVLQPQLHSMRNSTHQNFLAPPGALDRIPQPQDCAVQPPLRCIGVHGVPRRPAPDGGSHLGWSQQVRGWHVQGTERYVR